MSRDEPRRRREATLRRLRFGAAPSVLVRRSLAGAVRRVEATRRADAADGIGDGLLVGDIVALDAGCGDRSSLARFRARIDRLVGTDVHVPRSGAPAYLDAFVAADLCGSPNALPGAAFDVVLSSFTVEHLADPPAAFANIARWLRPGGTLVLSTVNRRHPFVAVYLRLPAALRSRLQPLVKESAEDAHPLVGICNDPASLRAALGAADFVDIHVRTVDNLARAWGRRRLTFMAGLIGDLLVRGLPTRRSTLVVTARIPERSR